MFHYHILIPGILTVMNISIRAGIKYFHYEGLGSGNHFSLVQTLAITENGHHILWLGGRNHYRPKGVGVWHHPHGMGKAVRC